MKGKVLNHLRHTSYLLVVSLLLAFSMQSSAEIVGQWLLNETSGTQAKDTSGQGKDGEIIGKAVGQMASLVEPWNSMAPAPVLR